MTDNLSNLQWEKKSNANDLHDKDSTFSWSNSGTAGDGSAYISFLQPLNSPGFAGFSDWRLPTLVELQSIIADFSCRRMFGGSSCICAISPCIDTELDATTTLASVYWTATTAIAAPTEAGTVTFDTGGIGAATKTGAAYIRAVRFGF